ncbi:MAG: hypothetical protein CMN85_17925 [Spongiibacteraceae bacterium]|nr:hypothetical protein [Spongiibacteraceae bacterium]
MSSFSDLIWIEIFLLGFGIFGWVGSFRGLRIARLIEDTPTSKIRSAPQGYIEIIGRSESRPQEDMLSAKLTGTPCVWYSFEIEKYTSNGKSSSWKTIEKGASKEALLFTDDTGHCFIHPDRADVSTHTKKIWHGSSRYPSSGKNSGLFSRRYRYTEKRIHCDQPIYALGHFETVHPPSTAAQTKAAMNTLINEWKQDYDALVAKYDRDDSGDIDLQEWEKVRADAQSEAAKQVRDDYDHTPVNIMSYSPARSQPFVISTSEPKALSTRYRWHFIGFGIVALGCTLGFFYFLPMTINAWRG